NMPVVQSSHQTSNDLSVSMNNMQTSRSIIIPQQNLSNQYPVRFNQELLHNFGINIPTSRQAEAKEASLSPSISTSLVPLPTSLSNNLGINNIHHMNQPSITPTIIG
ncbi:unnamed protein product, partial [Rotaria magnacalcarata]